MAKHGMKVVSSQTGLSPHVLRVWEKRYNAVTPIRTDTNRRIYTDSELRRLKNLSHLTNLGYSIGQIAKLPCAELQVILGKHQHEDLNQNLSENQSIDQQFITRSIYATKEMDQFKMEKIFDEATLAFGYSGLLERVLIPFMNAVGELWQNGQISSSDEHAASCAIRDYLARSARPYSPNANAPSIIVTTPSGQLHEIGAVIVSSLAKKTGWNVTYLGASLPAIEIAAAAIKRKARAVALSIVYPADDPHLVSELEQLRKHLPVDVIILAGGRCADSYSDCYDRLNVRQLNSITEFNQTLSEIRETTLRK